MHHPGPQDNGCLVVSVMNTMQDNGVDLSPKRGRRRLSLSHQSSSKPPDVPFLIKDELHSSFLSSTSHSTDSTSMPKLQRRISFCSTNGSAHVMGSPRHRRNSLNSTTHSCDSAPIPTLQRRNLLSSMNGSAHVTPRNRRNSLNSTTHSCDSASMPKVQRKNSLSSTNGSAHAMGSPRHRRNSLNKTVKSCDSIPIAMPKGRRNSISGMSHSYHSPTGKMSMRQRRNSMKESIDVETPVQTPRRNSMTGLNSPFDSTFCVAQSPEEFLSSPKKEGAQRRTSMSKADSNQFLKSPKPTANIAAKSMEKVARRSSIDGSKESRLVQKIEAAIQTPTKQRRRLSNNGPMETKGQLKETNLLDSPRRRTKTPSRRRPSVAGRENREVSSPRKAPVDKSLFASSRGLSEDTTADSSHRRTKTPSRRQRSEETDENPEGLSVSPRHRLRSPVRRRRDVQPSHPDSLLKSPTPLVSPTKSMRKSLVVMEPKSSRKLDLQKPNTPRSGLKKSLSMPALSLPVLDLPVVPRGVPILPAEPKIEPLKQKEPEEATGSRRTIKLSANRRDSPRRRARRDDDVIPPADFSGESPMMADTDSPRRSLVRAVSCDEMPLSGNPSNQEEFQSSTMRRRHETKSLPEWKRRLQSEPSSKDVPAPREPDVTETPTSKRRSMSRRGSARQSLAQASLLTDKLASPMKSSRPTFSRQPSNIRRCRTPDGRRSSNARRKDEPGGVVVEDFWMFGQC